MTPLDFSGEIAIALIRTAKAEVMANSPGIRYSR